MAKIDLESLRQMLETLGVQDGPGLSDLERAFVTLGLATALPCLNRADIDAAIEAAFRQGATTTQVQEIVSLVSGLGVHSLMVSTAAIVARAQCVEGLNTTFSSEQQALWDARVGDDPFWEGMEAELPGFLRSMLLLSADQFEAFFDYCAVPWKSGTVRAKVKELVALASDAMPTHAFMPGLRLHLRNAVKLGATRQAIEECLALAAATPEHTGVA
ncbi:carboxymuconolactone decarboxylase family protein [Novosphingobium resinovorum]|uniref:carboxymuconolactone decarboxylase family protein n=1 Tax=Novosphingobium resinovorum TaxID=158500 RepID=UPI002ED4D28F|nr:carboxymuconolactone decarboxylase family protein [Novosphingobium resinovorum]